MKDERTAVDYDEKVVRSPEKAQGVSHAAVEFRAVCGGSGRHRHDPSAGNAIFAPRLKAIRLAAPQAAIGQACNVFGSY
jgi:hypothetical protein